MASSLKPYITIQQPNWLSEAERICTIEEYMQNTSPALLGSTHFKNADYMIRELQPSSDKIDFQLIKNILVSHERLLIVAPRHGS